MDMTRRRFARALAGGSALLIAGSFHSGISRAATSIRLGYSSGFGNTQLMVACEESLWPPGATVHCTRLASGAASRDALLAGKIDAGTFGGTPFIVAAGREPVVAVMNLNYGGRLEMIVVRADSPIKSVAELKGKRIGAQVGGTNHSVFVNVVAPKFGLKQTDYDMLNVKYQDVVQAIVAGSIEAGVIPEPYASQGEDAGLVRVLMDYTNYNLAPHFLVVRAETIEKNREGVLAIMKGALAGNKMYRDDRKRFVDVLYKQLSQQGYGSRSAIEKAVDRIDPRTVYVPELRSYLANEAKALKDAGRIQTVPEWDKVLRTDLMHELNI